MKTTTVLLALAVAATCAAPGAAAATKAKPKVKSVCTIIKDDVGDASYNNVPGDGNDDVLSGDLASDAKNITGVIRLGALAQPDPMAPLGQGFFVRFTPRGTDKVLFVSARTYPQGPAFVYGYSADDPATGVNTSYTIGTATGVIDTAKKEVRITAPLSGFKAAEVKLVPGLKMLSLTAETYRMAGQGFVPSQTVGGQRVPLGGFLLQFDEGTGTSYVLGTPSCVKVGK